MLIEFSSDVQNRVFLVVEKRWSRPTRLLHVHFYFFPLSSLERKGNKGCTRSWFGVYSVSEMR